MRSVGRNVRRKDADAKVTGAARYIDDLAFPGMLYGRTIRSTIPRGNLNAIRLDFDRDGFTVVDYRDIPGRNIVALIEDDQPCLAEHEVYHVAEPVLLLAHADRAVHEDVIDRDAEQPAVGGEAGLEAEAGARVGPLQALAHDPDHHLVADQLARVHGRLGGTAEAGTGLHRIGNAVIIDIGESGNPSGIALGGRYDDEYVKTQQGWKFKSRTFTPSRVDVQPPPATGGRGGAQQPGPAPEPSARGRQ